MINIVGSILMYMRNQRVMKTYLVYHLKVTQGK